MAYCKNCKKVVKARFLDCEDCKNNNKICDVVICCECGEEIVNYIINKNGGID